MMENLVALVIATAVLVAIPGPNVALIVANAMRHGWRAGFMTVAGSTAGVALQLALVTLGVAALVEIAAGMLTWLK